ncbi:MAG: polysaccharide deacetylase family protein [Candidatus Nanoarchaeia archaeon]
MKIGKLAKAAALALAISAAPITNYAEPIHESEVVKRPKYEKILDVEKVPILMYHEIGNPKESEYGKRYTTTPEVFREQLQVLYENNYVPVSLEEFVNEDFPAGKRPYMLTFDDASRGQFNYVMEEGKLKPDPDSAVGILEEMAEKYSDFEAKAVFFVDFVDKKGYFEVPFGQENLEKQKLKYLAGNGYDVQCHTTFHHFISKESFKSLYNNTKMYEHLVEQKPKHESIAYPYGDIPDNSKKKDFIEENFDYAFGAWGNRNGNLAYVPSSDKFEPYNIPRIEVNNDMENIERYVLGALE